MRKVQSLPYTVDMAKLRGAGYNRFVGQDGRVNIAVWSQMAGVSQPTIRYFLGGFQGIKWQTMMKIIEATGLEFDDVVKWKKSDKKRSA